MDSASAFLCGFADICWTIHLRTFNLVVFSTIKGQSYPKSLKLNWMSRAKDFQHKAKAFNKLAWFSHIIVVQYGFRAVSTSTRHIYSSSFRSSFQYRVMQIIKTWDVSFFASGKFLNSRELYVSMSHVRTNTWSWVKRENG